VVMWAFPTHDTRYCLPENVFHTCLKLMPLSVSDKLEARIAFSL